MRVSCLALLASISFSLPAIADTYTYTYTGNDFTLNEAPTYPLGSSVSGEFTLSAPLPDNLNVLTFVSPTSFSFSAGAQTVTNLNEIGESIAVETNAGGDITYWYISVGGDPSVGGILTENEDYPDSTSDLAESFGGTEVLGNDPGTWTVTDSVTPTLTPEPSSLMLLTTGFLGTLGLATRRRKDA